ncbi:MAG: hypothetical protein OXK82_02035 [Deltaproteobacteria bacterium]|nr:hypothetical protein [Deltaproteobacteria bacterium]
MLELDRPQSVRHVFYRMTDPRLPEPVEKTEQGYHQVIHRMSTMRRAGRLPYGWIADASRRGYFTATFAGAGDFLERFASAYRADVWEGLPVQVEVWCESESLAGVLQADCRRMAVPLYPCRGYASLTFAYEAAQAMNADGRPGIIYYVGDYDRDGKQIGQSLERELLEHLKTPLTFTRLAINEDQIAEYDLPTKPAKDGGDRTVEAEAMPAATLRGLVSAAVESHLPPGTLESLRTVEQEERAGLRLLAEHLDRDGLDDVLERLE